MITLPTNLNTEIFKINSSCLFYTVEVQMPDGTLYSLSPVKVNASNSYARLLEISDFIEELSDEYQQQYGDVSVQLFDADGLLAQINRRNELLGQRLRIFLQRVQDDMHIKDPVCMFEGSISTPIIYNDGLRILTLAAKSNLAEGLTFEKDPTLIVGSNEDFEFVKNNPWPLMMGRFNNLPLPSLIFEEIPTVKVLKDFTFNYYSATTVSADKFDFDMDKMPVGSFNLTGWVKPGVNQEGEESLMLLGTTHNAGSGDLTFNTGATVSGIYKVSSGTVLYVYRHPNDSYHEKRIVNRHLGNTTNSKLRYKASLKEDEGKANTVAWTDDTISLHNRTNATSGVQVAYAKADIKTAANGNLFTFSGVAGLTYPVGTPTHFLDIIKTILNQYGGYGLGQFDSSFTSSGYVGSGTNPWNSYTGDAFVKTWTDQDVIETAKRIAWEYCCILKYNGGTWTVVNARTWQNLHPYTITDDMIVEGSFQAFIDQDYETYTTFFGSHGSDSIDPDNKISVTYEIPNLTNSKVKEYPEVKFIATSSPAVMFEALSFWGRRLAHSWLKFKIKATIEAVNLQVGDTVYIQSKKLVEHIPINPNFPNSSSSIMVFVRRIVRNLDFTVDIELETAYRRGDGVIDNLIYDIGYWLSDTYTP